MTEKQAWLYLAKKWDKPKKPPSDYAFVRISGMVCFGLCGSVKMLNITTRSVKRMLNRIEVGWSRTFPFYDNYRWPRTRAGAKSRAAFCRKMAKQLTKPKKGK